MGLWDKIKQGVGSVDLDAVKKAALDKLEQAKEANALADSQGESFFNWEGIKKHVEKIDPDKIEEAARTTSRVTRDAIDTAAEVAGHVASVTAKVAQLPDAEGRPTLTWGKLKLLAIKGANAWVEWGQDWAEEAAKPSSNTHGSAFTASAKELEAKGLGVKIPRYGDAAVDSSGLLLGAYLRGLLTYRGDTHHLVVAASGAGKFQAGVGVWLDNGLAGATVVIDPKGEAARNFAPLLEEAAILDPWNEAGFGSSALNLLDGLSADNPNLVDDARALADALIVPSGGDAHWDETAKNFVAALLVYIACDEHEADRRDMMRLRELVTLPMQAGEDEESFENLLAYMKRLDFGGGMVKRAANAMVSRNDKERLSILSSIERDTAWLESPQIQKVVMGGDLNLERFAVASGDRRGPVLFVVIPPRYITTHRAWLRLVIAAASNAFKRFQVEAADPWRQRRHIIIDEFPQLGRMGFVENDIAVARGYNIQYHLLAQNLTQLKQTYNDNFETFIANSLVQAFGMQDVFTSEYFSKMLGTTTVQAVSRSSGGSSSWSSQGSSSSSSSNTSSSPSGRPLRTPDELRTMPRDAQFIFLRGMNPVAASLLFLHSKRLKIGAPAQR